MDERCATGWGEKDIELTIPLGMDRKPIRKPHKKSHPTVAEIRQRERRENGIYILGAVIYLAIALIGGAMII